MMETRRCNACGEEWPDTGRQECFWCDSTDTYIVEDEADLLKRVYEQKREVREIAELCNPSSMASDQMEAAK